MQESPALLMKSIYKSFPGTVAVNNVTLRVDWGEVVGLVGENGAGKSTLMNILGGIDKKDSGQISIDGQDINLESPLDAEKFGIGYIHQELELFPSMSIAENIALNELAAAPLVSYVNYRELEENGLQLLCELGLDVDPKTLVGSLPYAEQTIVEIAKALSKDVRVIVFDEPTSALTEWEKENLFRIIRGLRERHCAIVFISHHLEEVLELCDRIVVMRDGEKVSEFSREEFDQGEVIRSMIGRRMDDLYAKSDRSLGRVILKVENLGLKGHFGGVSFQLRRREILGIAGLIGSGKASLSRTLFGMEKDFTGKVSVRGEPLRLSAPIVAKAAKMAFVSSDRHQEGLVLMMNVGANVAMTLLERLATGIFGVIDEESELEEVKKAISSLSIRTSGSDQIVNDLSGGNQQKVVIAKWLATNPELLILEEPTRGIDVGTKAEVHKLVAGLAEKGAAVVLISSEIDELIAIADRIAVMFEGNVVGELDRANFDRERIMQYATVGKR